MRLQTGPRAHGRLALGLSLAFAALPAAAQVGPFITQTLFFDQASNVHRGDYLETEAGLVATDNATFTETGASDTLALVGLAADTSRRGSLLDYHLDSDLTLAKYLRENFQSRPTGYLDGDADLKIVPGLFSWTARETYTDVVVNPLEPATPQNVESLNYLTTGPSLTLRPTLRTTVTIDGTYSYVNSGSVAPGYVDLDDHRYAGDARIDHALSNTSSLYAVWSTEQVYFRDRVDNTNFREDDGFVGFRYVDGRTVMDLSAGYDHLRAGTATPTGGIYRLQLSRVITPNQRLYLYALRQITDEANLLRLNVDQPVATSAPLQPAAGNPMAYRSMGADWRFQAGRTSLDVAFSDNSERFTTTPTFNNDIKIADALLGRQLGPVLNLSIGVEFQHQDFAAVSGPLQQVNAFASLQWQAGERLGLRLVYAHNALTPHLYAENQVGLIAYYGLIPPAYPAGQPLGPLPAMLPTSPMSTETPPQTTPQ
jgi:hypothetical protein